jgi:beta-galactosidase
MSVLPVVARDVIRLDSGWKFHKGDADAAAPTFDDSAWQRVAIPHTWNTEGDPPQSGYYRGPGWYRLRFAARPEWKGRRVFVRFEAASLTARVFLNGKETGEHKGGFQAFCFELAPLEAENVLAVRVDNSRREDVIPLGGDFTVFGGIYRPVSLIVTSPVDITPLDYASPGVFLKPSVNGNVAATVEVSNGSTSPAPIGVRVTIVDASRREVASTLHAGRVAAGETAQVPLRLTVPSPHLWNGVADPYLYTARVELIDDHKSIIDSLDQPLGFRTFSTDPQRGAVLNGKAQQIHGVCRHQDFGGLGWAIGPKEQDTDMALMREMGVNGVRLAHYQHNDYFYSLCDRNGLLVWAELPMVNDVRGAPEFLENARRQLTELIRQNFNHASIVMWSLYNELSPKNKDNPLPIVEDLKRLAKSEDAGRILTGAFSIDGIEGLPDVARTSELVALNVYPGWYIDTAASMGPIIDKWNAFYGSRGLIISEYGAGASIHQHQQDFSSRQPGRAPRDWHPEEWQSIVHEQTYAAIRERPAVPASFLWNMFDFASAGRKEGDTPGVNDKGLITRDRKVRKDAFYFYKANWTTEPMVYITSRRDTERTAPETPVKIYSNLPRVTLRVNGKSYGEVSGTGLHVFTWNSVPLREGENVIEAAAGPVRDSCVWTYHAKGPQQ